MDLEIHARMRPGWCGIVLTTDGAGIAAISILAKQHCNLAIRGPFFFQFFLP